MKKNYFFVSMAFLLVSFVLGAVMSNVTFPVIFLVLSALFGAYEVNHNVPKIH